MIWLSAHLACAALGREGIAREPGAPLRPSSGELAGVLADWASRESQVRSGTFEWRIDRRNQSSTFGALSVRKLSTAEPSSEAVRMLLDAHSFRLEGRCIPTVRLGELASFLSVPWNRSGGESSAREFDAAVRSRFADPERDREPQPYTIVVEPRREVHFWDESGQAYPRGLIMPVGAGSRALGSDSPAVEVVPLQFALLDALRLAVRPSSRDGRAHSGKNVRVLSDRPVVQGRSCLVIEEPLGRQREAGSRRLWIDSSRSGLVLRCILSGKSNKAWRQYDIDYDQVDGVWVPSKLIVLQLSDKGDPHDQLSATRESVILNPELPAELVSRHFPAATWVTDYIAHEQYIIGRDGMRRPPAVSEILTGAIATGFESERSADTPESLKRWSFQTSLLWNLLRLLTWPGILITLPAAYAVYLVGRVGCRRFGRRDWSSTETGSYEGPVDESRECV